MWCCEISPHCFLMQCLRTSPIYTKIFINTWPTPSPLTLPIPALSPLFPSNITYSFLSNWVRLVLTGCPWMWGHPLKCGWPTKGSIPIENWLSSSSYQLQVAPQLGMGFLGLLPSFISTSNGFVLVQVLGMWPLSLCVHRLQLQWSFYMQKTLFYCVEDSKLH